MSEKITKTIQEGTSLLERIQRQGPCTRMKLLGVPVDVRPMDGNAFRIDLDMSLPGAMRAAMRLNDAGTDIRPWKPKPTDVAKAMATWDTMLHYLVMTGDIC